MNVRATPRTDAEITCVYDDHVVTYDYQVRTEFARELERDLNLANHVIHQAKNAFFQDLSDSEIAVHMLKILENYIYEYDRKQSRQVK